MNVDGRDICVMSVDCTDICVMSVDCGDIGVISVDCTDICVMSVDGRDICVMSVDCRDICVMSVDCTDIYVMSVDCRDICVIVLHIISKTAYCKSAKTFLNGNQLLRSYQSGFGKFHSCHSTLIQLSEECLSNMGNGCLTGITFPDFRKAFDFVDHEILLQRENGRDLTQSSDKNPYTHRTIQKSNVPT